MPAHRRATPPAHIPWLLLLLVGLHVSPDALAGPPLPERIDALVAARAGGELGPASGDAEFVRRVYLDFAGRIPSVSETRAFLATPELGRGFPRVSFLGGIPGRLATDFG